MEDLSGAFRRAAFLVYAMVMAITAWSSFTWPPDGDTIISLWVALGVVALGLHVYRIYKGRMIWKIALLPTAGVLAWNAYWYMVIVPLIWAWIAVFVAVVPPVYGIYRCAFSPAQEN